MPVRRQGEHVVLLGGVPEPRPGESSPVVVDSSDALAGVVDRALRGELLVVAPTDDLVDPVVAELRRLGGVRLESPATTGVPAPRLDPDAQALLDLLAEGVTLGEAAARLHLSPRTANRRLAAARTSLGVRTTVEAVAASRPAAGSGADGATSTAVDLVGRDALVDEVVALLDQDIAVLLVGEGGVGKTSLMQVAAARDGRPRLAAIALESRRLHDADLLRRAVGDDGPVGDAESVAAAVERAVGPSLLVLDDVHLADDASIAALRLLVGHIAVLAAARDDGAAVDQLVEAGFRAVRVEALRDDDVVALTHRLAPGLTPDERARVAADSGGLPLVVEFLCGRSDAVAGRGLAAAVSDLDDDELASLVLLAVASSPRPPDEHAEALLAARLTVRDPDGRVRVRHGLVADAAIARADASAVGAAHRALAAEATDPAEAAEHLSAAGDRADATRLALAAWAEATDAVTAARMLALAAQCCPDERAPDLRVLAAEALLALGRVEEADRLVDPLLAAEDGDLVRRSRCLLVRTRSLEFQGDLEAAVASTVEGEHLATGVDDNLAGRLRVERAWCDLVRHGEAPTEGYLDRTRELIADGPGLALLHNVRGIAAYSAPDGGRAEYEAGRRAALAEGDVDAYLRCSNNLVMTIESSGSQAEGYALALELADESEARGLGEWRSQFLAMAGNLAMHRGDYREALRLTDLVRSLPSASITRRQATGTRASMLADLGLFDEAIDLTAELGGTELKQELDCLMYVHAWHLLSTGRAAEAAATVVVDPDPDRTVMIFSLPVRAWAEHELGRPVTPSEVEGDLVPMSAGPVAEVGAVALLAQRPAEAAERFDHAAALMVDRLHFPALRARWGAAEARRRAGHDVVDELVELEEEATESGLEPLRALVRRSLRLSGVTRASTRGMDREGLLTVREREVLDLAADGATLAEIARRLGLGRPTVRRIADNARRRMGAPTLVAAAAAVRASR